MKKILLVVSLAAAVLIGVMLWGSLNPYSWAGKLWSSKSSVATVESELYKLADLNTAEYRMRLIFPYDFTEGTADWLMYKNTWELNPSLFADRIDPAQYVDGQIPEEWKSGAFYRDCRLAGIDPFEFRYDFLVLSVVVKAGTDLSVFSESLGGTPPIVMKKTETGQKELTIDLPAPEIHEMIIEDLDNREWGYPDPPVSPEEWRQLVDFLRPRMEQWALDAGILEEADRQSRILLQGLLQDDETLSVRFL